MNYFMSDIHGNANAYFQMKEIIKLKDTDELYILGDVLDGNANHPEDCFKILDDIIHHPNIHLILGDHEYAHVLCQASRTEEEQEEWINYITDSDFGGETVFQYFSNLPEHDKNFYLSFLISCNVSQLIKIGQRYFYLCHGSPYPCTDNDFYEWQHKVVTESLNLTKNYFLAIKSDPDLRLPSDVNKDNLIILTGHTPTGTIFQENMDLKNRYYSLEEAPYQKIIYENKKMIIDCGCQQDVYDCPIKSTLACVGIDAAGFFTEYIRNL